MQGLSGDFEQFVLVKNNLLASAHNDADNANNADDYNQVIGIAQLNAFSCANKCYYLPVVGNVVKVMSQTC